MKRKKVQVVKKNKKVWIYGKLLWFLGLLVILLLTISCVWYIGHKKNTLRNYSYTHSFSSTPIVVSSTPTLPALPSQIPHLSIPLEWKTFTNNSKSFSFRYPSNWYPLPNPSYPDSDVSFFINGTNADFGYGDHAGNEVLAIEFGDDSRSLEELKNTYFPNANYVNISGKYALKTNISNPLYEILVSKNKILSIMVFSESDKYIDQIISSLNFPQ